MHLVFPHHSLRDKMRFITRDSILGTTTCLKSEFPQPPYLSLPYLWRRRRKAPLSNHPFHLMLVVVGGACSPKHKYSNTSSTSSSSCCSAPSSRAVVNVSLATGKIATEAAAAASPLLVVSHPSIHPRNTRSTATASSCSSLSGPWLPWSTSYKLGFPATPQRPVLALLPGTASTLPHPP